MITLQQNINIHEDTPVIIYTSKYVTLEGIKKEERFDYAKISSIVDKVMSGHTNLSKMEQEDLRVKMEALIINEYRAKEKADLRMNKNPEEEICVISIGKSYSAAEIKELEFNFHEDKLPESERVGRLPRINLMQQAFDAKNIFAISIVPFDPTIHQTWYTQKHMSGFEVNTGTSGINDNKIIDLFGFLPLKEETKKGKIERFGYDKSDQKADPNKPPKIFTGFFKPFSTFSSEVATPEFDPENLPFNVKKINAFSEKEVKKSISEIKNIELKDRIENIFWSFIEDDNAKGLGLTILEAPDVTRLYFSKEK
jgi:hypothetical protein